MDKQTALMLGAALACTVLITVSANKIIKKKCRKRRTWTKPWIKRRLEGKGILNMLNSELLAEDPAAYKNFLRMDGPSFEKLLRGVENKITKQDTIMRESISARSKLETTLRFLATGETYRSLMYSTRIHESTISRFIPEVCLVIYKYLQDKYLKTPNDERTWLAVAEGFENCWQFPNCIGALDGRHIKFRPPISAGSYYYNYKGDHSIVLLAMADASYKFIYYNVGINGRISDGGVFRESGLSKAIFNNSLNLPKNRRLPGQLRPLPYVIVADDAFPLSSRVMKPFPNRGLTYEQRIYNYRLSRARRIIESSFGILANRFRVLLNPINLKPEKVEVITLACIALHNFLATENFKSYTDLNDQDQYANQLERLCQQGGNRCMDSALELREEFKKYFNSPEGAVEWQNDAVRRNNM